MHQWYGVKVSSFGPIDGNLTGEQKSIRSSINPAKAYLLNNYLDMEWAGWTIDLLALLESFIAANLSAEVMGVRLPSYDSLGRLLWEISASEVRPMDNESYYALNPSFSILENRQATTTAKSSTGFDGRKPC